MKQQITIEVDVPDGYEATGEWRRPIKGECFLDISGDKSKVCSGMTDDYDKRRIILRKAWQPPAYLPDGCWVWKHRNSIWYASRNKPTYYRDGLEGDGDSLWPAQLTALASLHNDTFTPPPVDCIQVTHKEAGR